MRNGAVIKEGSYKERRNLQEGVAGSGIISFQNTAKAALLQYDTAEAQLFDIIKLWG